MKKILLSLFGIITLGLLNFGSCFDLSPEALVYLANNSVSSGQNISQAGYVMLYDMGVENQNDYVNYCVVLKNFSRSSDTAWRLHFTSNLGPSNSNNTFYGVTSPYSVFCVNGWRRYLVMQGPSSLTFSFDNYWVIDSSVLFSVMGGYNTCISAYTALSEAYDNCSSNINSCQSDLSSCNSLLSGYSNSLDICSSNYNNCSTSLNSCLQSNCPDSENPLNSNSTVYIFRNNSYFPITGTNNIYVNLPSYLGYDYDYSNAGNDLDIDVGVVVDEDYIDGLNAVQNYKPTSEDFTELIGILAPYSKILIFCVFLFIIWAWIKKPFKSKKL